MTEEALKQVHRMLGEVDDVIYRDARSRGTNSAYTEDETTLTEIIDEAQAQVTRMFGATT